MDNPTQTETEVTVVVTEEPETETPPEETPPQNNRTEAELEMARVLGILEEKMNQQEKETEELRNLLTEEQARGNSIREELQYLLTELTSMRENLHKIESEDSTENERQESEPNSEEIPAIPPPVEQGEPETETTIKSKRPRWW
ncbi:putative viral capsid assembly protein [Lysinibacillus phage phiG2]|nr:putative viral capsid assembly protein [Lysinibacillus phage phiG2]